MRIIETPAETGYPSVILQLTTAEQFQHSGTIITTITVIPAEIDGPPLRFYLSGGGRTLQPEFYFDDVAAQIPADLHGALNQQIQRYLAAGPVPSAPVSLPREYLRGFLGRRVGKGHWVR